MPIRALGLMASAQGNSANVVRARLSEENRGPDGRFRSLLSRPGVSSQWEKNSRYRLKLKAHQEECFSGYVRVFFVRGERRDFVPYSSRSGPFVRVFEAIVKERFRLERNERSAVLRESYLNNGLLGKPIELVRISAKDASCPELRNSRVKVYRYRRLPKLTRHNSEMKPLTEWLRTLDGKSALTMPWKDALAVCSDAIMSYRYISDQQAGYVGFPLRSAAIANNDEQNANQLAVRDGGSDGAGLGNSPVHRSVEQSTVVEGDSNVGISNRDTEGNCGSGTISVEAAQEQSTVEENDTTLRDTLRCTLQYLDLVRSDDLFMVLCMLFDERIQSKFHIIIGAFREKYNNNRVRAPYLVRMILQYAHEKAFAVNSGRDQIERERSLRSVKENFVEVRRVYGLKAYDEMCWPDLDEN